MPQGWKESRVTLIHKGGGKDKTGIGNYRPIPGSYEYLGKGL